MASYTVEETTGERVLIDMGCPYCEHTNEFQYGVPIPAGSKRTCESCGKTLKVTPRGEVSEYSRDQVEEKILPFIESQQDVKRFAKERGAGWKEWIYGRKSLAFPLIAYLFVVGFFIYGWLEVKSFPVFLFMIVVFSGWFVVPAWEKSQELVFQWDGGDEYAVTLNAVITHSDIYTENSGK